MHHWIASRQDTECTGACGSCRAGTRRLSTAVYWVHVTGVRAMPNSCNSARRVVLVRASRSVIDPAGIALNAAKVALMCWTVLWRPRAWGRIRACLGLRTCSLDRYVPKAAYTNAAGVQPRTEGASRGRFEPHRGIPEPFCPGYY